MTTHPDRINRLTRHGAWVLFLLLCITVLSLHRDVPYHDQWDLLPVLDRWYQGQLQFQDLLVPHNGHILLLPQLLMLGLAWLTHWNTLAEVVCNLLLGAVNYVLLLRLLCTGPGSTPSPALTRLPLAVLAFSLAQADNWLWGWQLQVPLCLSAVLAGTAALHTLHSPARAVMIASLCALAASTSFAAGLVFWFAAIPLVWQRGRGWLLLWLAFTVACASAYLLLLRQAGSALPTPTSPDSIASVLLSLIHNTLTCLGSLPGRLHLSIATAVGLLGAGGMAWLLCQPATTGQRAMLACLALFSLGAALLVAISRGSFGSEQMLASRYTTLTLPLWGSLLCSLLSFPHRIRWAGWLLVLLATATSAASFADLQRLHNRLAKGELALAQPDSPEGLRALRSINPRGDIQQAQREVALLAQYRLSFYREHKN